jgi:hypothetical protein
MSDQSKITTTNNYKKDREPPEPCFMIVGTWAEDKEEENNERTMGRKVSSKDD